MQLSDIRAEVLAHGFDPTNFNPTRLNQYINDGYFLICRRVDYYIDEATDSVSTTGGTATFPFPADLARIRSLSDTARTFNLQEASVRDLDQSTGTQGAPAYYAIDGKTIRLYPTPDGVYPLQLRYWKLPTALANDTDVPTLPPDWHHILWVYACWICYEAEDDASMGQYWKGRFMEELAEFSADQKFPSTDFPVQAQGMWDEDRPLATRGWSLYLG